MSGAVDVLAVLDEFALYVRNVSSRHALQGDILEARAAVADLIEKGTAFWRATDFGRKACACEVAKAFVVSLDNVGGAQ